MIDVSDADRGLDTPSQFAAKKAVQDRFSALFKDFLNKDQEVLPDGTIRINYPAKSKPDERGDSILLIYTPLPADGDPLRKYSLNSYYFPEPGVMVRLAVDRVTGGDFVAVQMSLSDHDRDVALRDVSRRILAKAQSEFKYVPSSEPVK